MKQFFLGALLTCLAFACPLPAAPGDVDAAFNTGSAVVGWASVGAIQPDGKVIIAGDFFAPGVTSRLVRLDANGTLDSTFNPELDDLVWAVAVQADGKILVGGVFTAVNGMSRNYIARLNADGSLDETFHLDNGADNYIYAIALQADGKALMAGGFTSINGAPRSSLARINPGGSLDTTFNPPATIEGIQSVAVQADGKVVVAGGATISRLNADGSLDSTFAAGIGTDSDVVSVVVQADGKILIVGSVASVNGSVRDPLARLNADGSVDSTFTPRLNAGGSFMCVAVQPDNKVVVGGFFTNINAASRNCIARLNADGALDNGFDPGAGADGWVSSVLVQPDGRLFALGSFHTFAGTGRNAGIARLNADGSVDGTFAPDAGLNGAVWSVAAQSDGKVLVGGAFTSIGATIRNHIGRLNGDGTLDSTFNPGAGANGTVYSVVLQTDGKVLVGGAFTMIDGTRRNRIARLNADGSLDSTFKPVTGANNDVYAVAVQSDGKVLMGGLFTSINGSYRYALARLNPDGSLDSAFNPGDSLGSWINSVAVQPDGKIVAGAEFFPYVARLNPDGTLDSTFKPGTSTDAAVYCVTLQADGKVLLGGAFNSISGMKHSGIGRLDANGSLDSTFNASAHGQVWAIVMEPDGKALVGGSFGSINGGNRSALARLSADGSLDSTFGPGAGVDGGVLSLALQPDGKVLVGGGFDSIDNTSRNRVGRLLGDAPALSVHTVGIQMVLTWANAGFSLQSAPVVTGPFTNITGAVSPYSVPMAGPQGYFRLKAN